MEVIQYAVKAGDPDFTIVAKCNRIPESDLWGNYETLNDDPQPFSVVQQMS